VNPTPGLEKYFRQNTRTRADSSLHPVASPTYLHDRRQSSVHSFGWPEARGHGRLLDLGAEVASHNSSPSIHQRISKGLLQCPASLCISLQAKHATQHLNVACRSFLSAALHLLDIAPNIACPGSLATTPRVRSRILASQTAKAPRPCSWQFVPSPRLEIIPLLVCQTPRLSLDPEAFKLPGSVPALPHHRVPSTVIASYPVLSYLLLLSSTLPTAT
jgi:hypothetical protein